MAASTQFWTIPKQREAVSTRLGGIALLRCFPGATAINSQVGVYPCAAGLAISNDGKTLIVANYYNDSITIFSGGYPNWSRREPATRQDRYHPERCAGWRISVLGRN